MGRTLRCCALMLAMVSAPSVCGAQVRDCWLLDGRGLERARAQGLCQDSFARNGGVPAKRPAVHPNPRPKTSAPDPAPQVAEVPSWNAPREEAPRPAADEVEIARPGAEAAPPPQDSFADGLRRDLEYFVQDLDRDITSFWRALAGRSAPGPGPDVRVSER